MMDFSLARNVFGALFCYRILWIGCQVITVEGQSRGRFPGLRFLAEPEDVNLRPGSTTELKCNARYKNINLDFKWILNGSELVLANVVPGKTFIYKLLGSSGNLRIENISGEAYGVYQCVASYHGNAIISRKARVMMPYLYKTNDEPTTNVICNETSSCVLKPPDLASFPEPSFAWAFRRNSNETFSAIENSHGGSAMFVVSLEGHLCILGVSQRHQGQYRCGISNDAGAVYELYNVTIGRSNISNGQSNTRHELSILVKPKNITVGVSSSASFDCIVSEKNAEVLWLKGDKEIDSISLPYRLIVKQTSADNEGWYTCNVSNNFTTVSQKAFLNVKDIVMLNANWPERQEIMQNQVLILKAVVNYGQLQWYWNGQPIERSPLNGSSQNVRINVTRKVTRIGHEIVKDEQTLRVGGETRSGTYQVLATGFNRQESKHTEVTAYSCGATLTGLFSSLSTPNFPGFYPPNIACLWLIKPHPQPKSDTLYIEIDYFHVGCEDSLEIYDGTTSNSGMLGSFPSRKPTIFMSHLSAFRLVFKSRDSCGSNNYTGFNATYWISEPTTNVTATTTPAPPKRETNGQATRFTTIMNTGDRPTLAEKTSTENTASVGESSSNKNLTAIYGVVVFFCVAILAIALLIVIRRKGYLILTCIKGNDNDNTREGTERQGHELSEYPSGCEIILYDTPGENDPRQPANETQDGPLYDVLESPGEEQGCDNPGQSTNIYASVNEGCVTEEDCPTSPSRNFEVSFLEEIYTTLTADRDNEDANIYESLRRENSGNERCDGWSVEGMQRYDEDYVSIVS